jgi:hypothetical protein
VPFPSERQDSLGLPDPWIGLVEDGYLDLKNLASRLEKAPDLCSRVQLDFLIDEIIEWFAVADQTLTSHIAARCAKEIARLFRKE